MSADMDVDQGDIVEHALSKSHDNTSEVNSNPSSVASTSFILTKVACSQNYTTPTQAILGRPRTRWEVVQRMRQRANLPPLLTRREKALQRMRQRAIRSTPLRRSPRIAARSVQLT